MDRPAVPDAEVAGAAVAVPGMVSWAAAGASPAVVRGAAPASVEETVFQAGTSSRS